MTRRHGTPARGAAFTPADADGSGRPGYPARAFDAVAAEYDDTFSFTGVGRWYRAALREWLEAAFPSGSHVLELGCGTGEDTVWLASRGVHVTAVDASAAMLEVARAKVARARAHAAVRFVLADLADLRWPERLPVPRHTLVAEPAPPLAEVPASATAPFHGALAAFGVLNCLDGPARMAVARTLAALVHRGARVILVVMGPLCPWEIAWHLLRGRPGAAARRWRSGACARVGDGEVQVWYPSPRRLAREFGNEFAVVGIAGIGALLPPPYLEPLVRRRPSVFQRLARLERRWSATFPWTWLNDHYLLALERR